MKKLALKLDALEVQSFETAPVARTKGTVEGNAAETAFCSWDCTEEWTCGVWCPPTQDPNPTEPCAC